MSEKLSSLLDSELDAAEQGVLIQQLEADAELAAKWSRYSLVSHLITRSDEQSPVIGDISARIAERIKVEPTAIAPDAATLNFPKPDNIHADVNPIKEQPKDNVTWLTPLRAGAIGFAMAASIAAISVLGLNQGLLQTSDAPVVASQTSVSESISGLAAASGSTRWDTDVAAHENDLNSLLVEHGEFMPPSGLNGLMAYAKFVSYDAQQREAQ